MTEFVPKWFKGLGKSCSDLFKDPKAKLTSKFVSDRGSVSAKFTETLKVGVYGIDEAEVVLDTGKSPSLEVTNTSLADGLTVKAKADPNPKGVLTLKWRKAPIAATVDVEACEGDTTVNASAVLGFDGLSVGGAVKYEPSKEKGSTTTVLLSTKRTIWSSPKHGFKNFFLKFGAIDDCVVMRDKITGESRGFGFVTFNEKDAMEKALEEKDTLLDGRNLDIKLAIPREEMERQEREKQFGRDPYRPPPVKKVFVRGLADKTSQAEFEGYFAKYGEITDAVIMVDRETQNPRGFGFVTFSDEAIVDKVVGQSHKIGGKLVTCEKAKPRESKRPEPAFDNRFERGPAYDRFDGRSFDRPQSGYRTYQPVEPARDYGYQAYTQPAAAGYDTRSQYVAAPGYDYSGGGGGYTTSQYTGQYTSGNVATTGYARNQDFSRAQTYQTRDRTSYHPYARR